MLSSDLSRPAPVEATRLTGAASMLSSDLSEKSTKLSSDMCSGEVDKARACSEELTPSDSAAFAQGLCRLQVAGLGSRR